MGLVRLQQCPTTLPERHDAAATMYRRRNQGPSPSPRTTDSWTCTCGTCVLWSEVPSPSFPSVKPTLCLLPLPFPSGVQEGVALTVTGVAQIMVMAEDRMAWDPHIVAEQPDGGNRDHVNRDIYLRKALEHFLGKTQREIEASILQVDPGEDTRHIQIRSLRPTCTHAHLHIYVSRSVTEELAVAGLLSRNINTHTHTHTHPHAYTHAHTHTRTRTHTLTHKHTHTHTRSCRIPDARGPSARHPRHADRRRDLLGPRDVCSLGLRDCQGRPEHHGARDS